VLNPPSHVPPCTPAPGAARPLRARTTGGPLRLGRRIALPAALIATAVWIAFAPAPARAQEWPDRPITAFDGRVVIGGEALVTIAPEDVGFFNYTDYERSALQLVRLGLVTMVHAADRLSFVAELRAEGDTSGGPWTGVPYAAYVRLRPWRERPFELQAGRIPPAFGGFLRRSYGRDNPLIGYPLAYQYLTSLRHDALPRHADDLIERRGTGWYTGYPVGSPEWRHGVPLVSAFRYDTGVLARTTALSDRLEVLGSVTTGTLSNPRGGDDNGSAQVAGRIAARPVTGLVLAASAAHGGFLAGELSSQVSPGTRPSDYSQRSFGADVEYSRAYWLVRAEWLRTSWQVPALAAPAIGDPLSASALAIEGRYTLLPGLYAAARVDRLSFATVPGTAGPETWDADVSRVEAGIGYSLTRHIVVKAVYQHNRRDGGRVRRANFGAAQLLLWF